ncbi:hypothetical protein C8J57DRAFT_1559467 [Mycena rebaudengoi]|nr:hypothetical protein C8J57DRAFT_1559467 [Mycena rebaudengoi]
MSGQQMRSDFTATQVAESKHRNISLRLGLSLVASKDAAIARSDNHSLPAAIVALVLLFRRAHKTCAANPAAPLSEIGRAGGVPAHAVIQQQQRVARRLARRTSLRVVQAQLERVDVESKGEKEAAARTSCGYSEKNLLSSLPATETSVTPPQDLSGARAARSIPFESQHYQATSYLFLLAQFMSHLQLVCNANPPHGAHYSQTQAVLFLTLKKLVGGAESDVLL